MTERQDIHRPGAFDPADYRVIDYLDNKKPEPPRPPAPAAAYDLYEQAVVGWKERVFAYFPDWRTGGGDHQSISQCNHCGHPGIRWVAVVEHVPTGSYLAFGETCAERCELPGRDAFKAKFVEDRAAREQAAYERRMARAAFAETAGDVVAFLEGLSDDYDSGEPDFLLSLKRQLSAKGELSDAQVEAARKFLVKRQEREARIAAENAALADAPLLAEGRREVVGEVVTTKWKHNDYGGALKMLVREPDGNKVWGTVPEALARLIVSHIDRPDPEDWTKEEFVEAIDLRGRTVTFTATIERSADDAHFGFFKKPTKATLAAVTA